MSAIRKPNLPNGNGHATRSMPTSSNGNGVRGGAQPPKRTTSSAIANAPTSVQLTPTQRHYLLKLLVCAQMHDEWSLLDEGGALRQYGAPFADVVGKHAPPDAVGQQHGLHPEHTRKPLILLHMFHVHLRRFPGLDRAEMEYWRKLIVPFFDKVANAHLSNSAERSELTNRKVLNITATRYFSTFFARGVGIRCAHEERGPGKGEEGSEAWGPGKAWGKGTVKRGLGKPLRPSDEDVRRIDFLFEGASKRANGSSAASNVDGYLLWQAGKANTRRVKGDWSAWKESIIESENGLDDTLRQLQIKYMSNLPDRYRNAAEWVRRHVAFVIWTILVKYPGGDEIFGIIKTIHFLFPYWGAKQLLKIANAQKMIKAIIDLILARPLGAIDSLGQRIFFTIMGSEIDKIKQKILAPLRKAIGDEQACKVIDEYVTKRTSVDRAAMLQRAKDQGADVLTVVLQEYGYGHGADVRAWQDDYVHSLFFENVDWAYPDECRQAKYQTEPTQEVRDRVSSATPSARRFALLKLYLRESLRKRDRVDVLEIGSGPLVPSVIRESLEIVFYKLLYDIARSANLSARLQDFQNFIDDLIKTKSSGKDALEDYVALAARHEANLYLFVHEIRDAVKPVFDWCQAALDYMAISTTDPWHPSNNKASRIEINLDAMLTRAVAANDVDLDSVLKELGEVEQFTRWDKIKTELAMRKEYALITDDAVTNVTLCEWTRGGLQKGLQADDERIQASSQTRKRLSDLDGLMNELLEQADLYPDDGQIPANGARGTDTAQIPWAFFTPDDVLLQRFAERLLGSSRSRTYAVDGVQVPPPMISNIRALLPVFREDLAKCIPDWVTKAKSTPPRSKS